MGSYLLTGGVYRGNDQKALGIDTSYEYTTLWVYVMPLQKSESDKYYVYFTTILKR